MARFRSRAALNLATVVALSNLWQETRNGSGSTRSVPRRNGLGYHPLATAALAAWEWLQREEHLFGALEIAHYRPKEQPNSVRIVHPKTGEEAWWPLFSEAGEVLFPELMAELDAIKAGMVSGLVFRRDHAHRRKPHVPLPWMTERGGLDYLRAISEGDSAIRGPARRTIVHIVPPRRLHRRRGLRSHRRRATCSRPSSLGAATPNLRQTHTQAAHLGRAEAQAPSEQNRPGLSE